MSVPEVVSREEWTAARKQLLQKEKAATKARDELNAERRRLPMVRIEKHYVFEGPDGRIGLVDLFEGRRQLIIYHFMFDPSWDEGCKSCSAWTDQIARGHLTTLHSRDTTLALVSRAPFPKLQAFKERMGWKLPWYSSYGSDFNYDFHVTLDESVVPIEYNYRDKQEHDAAGTGFDFDKQEQPFELPGISCLLRDGDAVFHTYSTYARGGETVGGGYYLLDLTALGRQEEWEEPKGRSTKAPLAGDRRLLYPDEYETNVA